MKDIFDAEVLCPTCNTRTKKEFEIKEGHKLRYFQCLKCSQRLYHPIDIRNYEEFKKLSGREFQVKLRMVGNSFSVTIPKEIIDFEERFEVIQEQMDRFMRLSLEEPGKISLCFRRLFEE